MENSQKPQTKTIAGLISFIVLLVLAVLGLVTAYYFQSDHVTSLEYQVAHLKTSAEDAKKSEKAPAAVMYREIPELGVKYKLTSETKYLTYSFDQRSVGIKSAHFSTVQLVGMKDSQGSYPCSQGFSGMLVGYDKKPLVRNGVEVKEIAGRYYITTPPQNACMIDGVVAPGLKESYSAVKAAFDSLEAM